MNRFKEIDEIWNDICMIPSTTVVIPRLGHMKDYTNEKTDCYYCGDYGFKVSFPKSCVVKESRGRTTFEQLAYPVNSLFHLSLVFGRQANYLPIIDITVEDLDATKFSTYFAHRLQALQKAGVEAEYRSDDYLKLITMKFNHVNNQGFRVFNVQKYYVHQKHVYNLMISDLRTKQVETIPALRQDIKFIVGSFTFIEKASP